MFEVIYEDKDFLVLNKPAGVLVHPVARRKGLRWLYYRESSMPTKSSILDKVGTRSGQSTNRGEETIVNWLLRYYPEVKGVGDPSAMLASTRASTELSRMSSAQAGQDPSAWGSAEDLDGELGRTAHPKSSGQATPARPGIVHRLDRDTSGVLLVARTQPFFEYMKRLFQAHEVEKTYLALVHGRVKGRGVINTPIGLCAGSVKRSPVPKQSFGTGRSVRARHIKMVKEAITEYRPLKVFERLGGGELFTLVELTPRTGRTHQLRVHLASIGHPVAGDALYGRKGNPLGLLRHFLHAASLEFSLPEGRRVRFDAELPGDLQRVMDGLREIAHGTNLDGP